MELMRDVMDQIIADRQGFKAGRVDDILLELRPGKPPRVTAIVTGHGALARILGGFVVPPARIVRGLLLGEEERPITVAWEHITRIDVAVHVDLDREGAGLVDTEQRIWRRWLRPLPFSRR